MHLHYMLVLVLIPKCKGGDTNDGLTVALNHNTAQGQAVDFELFRGHGWNMGVNLLEFLH